MIFDDKEYIAKKIREYRKKSGLTQAELAEKIDIGTKQISRLEIGDFYPSLNTFFRLVKILNIDLSDFIPSVPINHNETRKKIIEKIYNATDDELNFYDRLITFANDEVAEIKKNILIKNMTK
ncbi:helix-turn-helix transcriptional regulator [bacterium]|nr:helix-turn-helix transcriptional regulator [bacterium]